MNKKPAIIDPRIIGAGRPKQMQLTPELIKKGENMNCMNEIPKLDERGKPIEGEVIRCNSPIFVDAYNLKYISPILSPAGINTVGNIMIGKLCVACGKLFSPDEWMKEKDAHDKAVKDTVLDKKGGDKRADP